MNHTESGMQSMARSSPSLASDGTPKLDQASEYLGSSHLIHQIVDPRERIPILYRDPVQLAVIDAHTLRTVLFVDEDRRRSLRGGARPNEPGLQIKRTG